jgi:hypothetical protein
VRRFFLHILVCVFTVATAFAQSDTRATTWDIHYLNGPVLEHNPDIGQLILGHTQGILIKYNRPTFGEKEWQQRYNYPDWGVSFLYQNLGNPVLGDNLAAYGHYNFYFLNRNLSLTLGTGIAYNTNPYDAETNFRNLAYGSHLMSTSMMGLAYKKERVLGDFGFEAGVQLVHYSNGRLRTPNTSTNILTASFGVNYDPLVVRKYQLSEFPKTYSEPIHVNVTLQGGVNENNIIGLDRKSFAGLQVFADKRLSYKSTVQFGAELFLSGAMKQYIEYRAIAFPEEDISLGDDSKRIGLFAGYELRVSRTAIFAHLGYYVYYPVNFEGRIYNRLGVKRYFGDHFYGLVAVKAHAAKAEALEFGIGYRL